MKHFNLLSKLQLGLLAFQLLQCAAHAQSPVWVTIATESQTTSVTFPTAVLSCQFGSPTDNKWSLPFAVAAGTVYKELYWPLLTSPTIDGAIAGATGQMPFADPDKGQPKTLQCAEQAAAYTVATPGAPKATVTVPALPVVVVTPPVQPSQTFTYTITVDTTGKVTGATCTAPVVSK